MVASCPSVGVFVEVLGNLVNTLSRSYASRRSMFAAVGSRTSTSAAEGVGLTGNNDFLWIVVLEKCILHSQVSSGC